VQVPQCHRLCSVPSLSHCPLPLAVSLDQISTREPKSVLTHHYCNGSEVGGLSRSGTNEEWLSRMKTCSTSGGWCSFFRLSSSLEEVWERRWWGHRSGSSTAGRCVRVCDHLHQRDHEKGEQPTAVEDGILVHNRVGSSHLISE
jgi:hypothetical protein